MLELRKRIAESAEIWLRNHVPEYVSQEANSSDRLSPDEFVQVAQYRRWEEKSRRPVGANTQGQPDTEARFKDLSEAGNAERFKVVSFVRKGILRTIEEHRKLIILGDPGLGKTTSLRYLTRQYAKDSRKPLPIYLELKYYRVTGGGLKGLIKSAFNVAPEVLKDQQLILMLDGFNELGPDDQGEVLRDLFHLQAEYVTSRYVISSRKAAYPRKLEGWATCELLQLDELRIRRYLVKILGDMGADTAWQAVQDQNLLDLARVPLMLRFICDLFKTGCTIPTTKGALLHEIIKYKYLQGYTPNKSPADVAHKLQNLSAEKCTWYAAMLAHEVFKQTGRIDFTEDLLSGILKENWSSMWPVIKLFEELRLLERHVLRDDGRSKTIYSFWHQSLFEYFVGYHLYNILISEPLHSIGKVAFPYFEFYKWDEAVKIALSLCNDDLANRLFLLALEQDILLALTYLPVVEEKLPAASLRRLSGRVKELLTNWLSPRQMERHNHEVIQFWESEKRFGGLKELVHAVAEARSKSLVSILIPILKIDDPEILEVTASALGKIGDAKCIPYLVPLLADKDKRVRASAVESVGEIGDLQCIPQLVLLLNDKEWDVRELAAGALGKMGSQAISYLISLLRDREWSLRLSIIKTFGKVGSEAIPYLMALLKDKEWSIRQAAANALSEIREPQTIPVLLSLLEDQPSCVREAAVNALGEIGDIECLSHIIPLLADEDWSLRETTAEAISKFGPEALPPLSGFLEHPDWRIREVVAEAIGKIGGPSCISYLSSLIEDEEWSVCCMAAQYLAQIRDPRVIPYIVCLLENHQLNARDVPAETMAQIDPGAIPYLIPFLLTTLETGADLCTYWSAIRSLAIMGSQAIPHLIPLLQDRTLCCAVIDALGEIGDRGVVSHLIPLLRSGELSVTRQAIHALGEIGDREAVPHLIPLLRSGELSVTWEAIHALGEIGDREAVPHLIAGLKGFYSRVAVEALGKIGDVECLPAIIGLLEIGLLEHKWSEILGTAEAFGKIIHNQGKSGLSKNIYNAVDRLRKRAVKDELTFQAFTVCQRSARRRLIWFDESNGSITQILQKVEVSIYLPFFSIKVPKELPRWLKIWLKGLASKRFGS